MKVLLKKIPGNWHELKLSTYQQLTKIEITENDDMLNGIENTIKVLAVLTGEPVETFETIPFSELQTLGNKVNWISTPPTPDVKSRIKWKAIDDITFNQFITYNQLQNEPLSNLHLIIKDFSKTKMSEVQILNMPADDALTALFFFKNQLMKSANHLTMWQRMKDKMIARQMKAQQLLVRIRK